MRHYAYKTYLVPVGLAIGETAKKTYMWNVILITEITQLTFRPGSSVLGAL